MSGVTTEAIKQFAQYGGYIGLLTAILIIALGAAVVFLWKQMTKIQDASKVEIEALQKEFRDFLTQIQDKRIAETKDMGEQVAKVNEETNLALRGLTDALNNLKDVLLSRR